MDGTPMLSRATVKYPVPAVVGYEAKQLALINTGVFKYIMSKDIVIHSQGLAAVPISYFVDLTFNQKAPYFPKSLYEETGPPKTAYWSSHARHKSFVVKCDFAIQENYFTKQFARLFLLLISIQNILHYHPNIHKSMEGVWQLIPNKIELEVSA